MRNTRWTLLAILLAISTACFAQQGTPIKSPQLGPAAPIRDPHSSPADLAVPMCPASFNDSLATDGIADAKDKTVMQPKVIHSVNSEFSKEARETLGVAKKKKKKQVESFDGVSVVSFVVDDHGNPQNLCISKSTGYGLDANAAKAVQQNRFDPATMNGKPVAKRISIEVDFTLH